MVRYSLWPIGCQFRGITLFFFQIRVFFGHFWPLKIDPNFSFFFFQNIWMFMIICKVCTIFWYQVYQNQIKTKETMIFFFFYFFLLGLAFSANKRHPKKKTKIITETLFFIRFWWYFLKISIYIYKKNQMPKIIIVLILRGPPPICF